MATWVSAHEWFARYEREREAAFAAELRRELPPAMVAAIRRRWRWERVDPQEAADRGVLQEPAAPIGELRPARRDAYVCPKCQIEIVAHKKDICETCVEECRYEGGYPYLEPQRFNGLGSRTTHPNYDPWVDRN